MAQLESSFEQFRDRKTSVVLIAAQKPDGIFRGRDFINRHGYPFPLLFDERRQVTRSYGIYQPLGVDAYRIARPAIFLVDDSGRIRWIAVGTNQRDRPKIPDVIAAIEAYGRY